MGKLRRREEGLEMVKGFSVDGELDYLCNSGLRSSDGRGKGRK
jgi:hypothetical protein